MERLTDLREILRHVPHFRDKVFVISMDGAIVADDNFTNLLLDIAVLRSLRIGVVLVHGAGYQIEQLSKSVSRTPSNVDGTGVTDAETLELALTAATRVTHEIIAGLAGVDLRAAAGNALVAHPAGILGGVDHQFTGRVERVDVALLQSLARARHGAGRCTARFRWGGAHLPAEFGCGCGGRGPGIAGGETHQPRAAPRSSAGHGTGPPSQYHGGGAASQEAGRRIGDRRALEAVPGRPGSPWWRAADPYHRWSSSRRAACGSLFLPGNWHARLRQRIPVDPAGAKKDVRAIHSLIQNGVRSDELLQRTRAEIERQISDFYVFEVDRSPVACVALHFYADTQQVELACLFVGNRFENQGIGIKLSQYAETVARAMGAEQLFCLSTQTFNFFVQKAGYRPGSVDDLPPNRRERYERSGRRSQVLIKSLNATNSAGSTPPLPST